MQHRLHILTWHNVEGTWYFPSRPGSGVRGLERQFRLLRRVANVLPLEEALGSLLSGRPLPPRCVALTFDDGYRDNLELAAPILEGLGLPATFFLVPGFLSREVDAWWERLAWSFTNATRRSLTWDGREMSLEDPAARRVACVKMAERLKRQNRLERDKAVVLISDALEPSGSVGDLFMDWDEARRLARRGFEIGSHSMYHAILSEETPEDQASDLKQSRRLLEEQLDVSVASVAYPNGTRKDYDQTTVAAAQAAGYSDALTLVHGANDRTVPPFEIRRYLVFPERGERGLAIMASPAVAAYRAARKVARKAACRPC
jgi:peptidoglycan/xylan/chitin deacetylase (PgdA/CDA1 family)